MLYVYKDEFENVCINHKPFDEEFGLGESKEVLEKKGFFIENIPPHKEIEGKVAIRKVDFIKKEIYYDYIDNPKTREQLQQEEINQLQLDNSEIMMKSATQDLELQKSKQDIGELMLKVATLEMGGNL